jgi:tRNA(Ile)-lysidine synthase
MAALSFFICRFEKWICLIIKIVGELTFTQSYAFSCSFATFDSMKHPFEEKVGQSIACQGLLADGECVIVALSGGADSVALLSVLTALGYRCVAAHCDFHLRGSESERDRQYAHEVADAFGAEYVEKHYDAGVYCAEHGISVEMGCRDLRYDWFEQLSKSYGGAPVAVGHHSDDNVETLMLNLLRGSGLTGLTGMRARHGIIVRPLLGVKRCEIVQYLSDKGIEYVTDSSNLVNDVKRNKLRNVLLPAIRAYFPDANSTLSRSIKNLTANLELYLELIERCSAAYCTAKGEYDVARMAAEVKNAPTMLYELIRGYGFNASQCAEIIVGVENPAGRRFFADEYVGVLHRGTLIVRSKLAEPTADESYEIDVDDATTWPEGFAIERIEATDAVFDNSGNTLYLDVDKLGDRRVVVRRWRKGDRIAAYGLKGSKLVSDLYSDAHYSPIDKEQAWLMTANGQIVWAVGLRTSRHMTLSSKSLHALRFTYTPPQ